MVEYLMRKKSVREGRKMNVQKSSVKRISLMGIQKLFFRTQLVLILSLALILGVAGTLINIHFETHKRDQNLQNVAEAIAQSPMLTGRGSAGMEDREIFSEYLDTLRDTLDDIDVISVVNKTQFVYIILTTL